MKEQKYDIEKEMSKGMLRKQMSLIDAAGESQQKAENIQIYFSFMYIFTFTLFISGNFQESLRASRNHVGDTC